LGFAVRTSNEPRAVRTFAGWPTLGVLSTAPDPGLGSVAFGLGSDQRNTITDFTDAQGLYATGEPLQAAAPDPGLGSVAFGLGSNERNTITDFTDAQGLYATGEPLQAATAAVEDQLYEPLTDQPDVESEEVFETPGFQGQVEEPDAPVDLGTPEQRQQQLQRFRTIFDLTGQLDADIGISTVDLQGTIADRTPSQQQLQGMSAAALTDMNNQILTLLGQYIEQPDVRPYVNATTQLKIRKNFPGLWTRQVCRTRRHQPQSQLTSMDSRSTCVRIRTRQSS
jgi:hypothetical protein